MCCVAFAPPSRGRRALAVGPGNWNEEEAVQRKSVPCGCYISSYNPARVCHLLPHAVSGRQIYLWERILPLPLPLASLDSACGWRRGRVRPPESPYEPRCIYCVATPPRNSSQHRKMFSPPFFQTTTLRLREGARLLAVAQQGQA